MGMFAAAGLSMGITAAESIKESDQNKWKSSF
jgi:hypothetical protein